MPLSLQADLTQCMNADSVETPDDATAAADSMHQPHQWDLILHVWFHPVLIKDALHMPISA